MRKLVLAAAERGHTVRIHVIGDGAIHAALDIFEEAAELYGLPPHGFGAASSSVLVWQTFALNARYGEHGLMKLGAIRSHPRYLINRRRITRLFKRKRKEETT